MTHESRDKARATRLAQALRENLKRRKAQSRGRLGDKRPGNKAGKAPSKA